MSLDQLRYFVAVAEEEHLGRAADKLHISAPPLSRHIKALEDEVGGPLFERTPRGMRLLPSGAELLERGRRILTELDEAVSAVQHLVGRPPPNPSTAQQEHSGR